MRNPGRRPVLFIGITQTGLTTSMVYRIARAISSLPVQEKYSTLPTKVEMQKVSVGRTLFFLPFPH